MLCSTGRWQEKGGRNYSRREREREWRYRKYMRRVSEQRRQTEGEGRLLASWTECGGEKRVREGTDRRHTTQQRQRGCGDGVAASRQTQEQKQQEQTVGKRTDAKRDGGCNSGATEATGVNIEVGLGGDGVWICPFVFRGYCYTFLSSACMSPSGEDASVLWVCWVAVCERWCSACCAVLRGEYACLCCFQAAGRGREERADRYQ